jgi:putative hydrolase of the HAD superfamily
MSDLVRGIGEHLTPIHETVALLQRLHSRRQAGEGVTGLYYLSNMPPPYARFLEGQHSFLRCFDGGIFSGDVHRIKPEPEIYALLESRFALQPDQIVFIDDLKHNVEAATERGWQGIQFESAAQLQAQLLPLLA